MNFVKLYHNQLKVRMTCDRKMAQLNIFLCLTLFGVCIHAFPQLGENNSVGSASLATRKELDALQPKLAAAINEWPKSTDFNIDLKIIKSGTIQTVADTFYDLVIEDTSSIEWNVKAVQKLDGKFKEIILTRPTRSFTLIWR